MDWNSLATRKRIVVGVSLGVAGLLGMWRAYASPKTGARSSKADEFRAAPSPARLERGRYLVESVAHWAHHSSQPLPGRKGVGQPVTHEAFNGEPFPEGLVIPNITPDPTGISHYDEAMFIKTIRTGRASGGVRELNPLMPYSYFQNMTDDDLKAIFAYLRTLKPVRHNVDNSEEVMTLCPLCRNKHGFGDRN